MRLPERLPRYGEQKRNYRSVMHNLLLQYDNGEGLVLILPGHTNQEIDALLSRGVSPERLFLVDKSPQRIANRKIHVPLARGRGIPLEDIPSPELKDVRIAHLDFCGIWDPVGAIAKAICHLVESAFSRGGVLGIAFLKGRDAKRGRAGQTLQRRFISVRNEITRYKAAQLVKTGSYYSDAHCPMEWGVFLIQGRYYIQRWRIQKPRDFDVNRTPLRAWGT